MSNDILKHREVLHFNLLNLAFTQFFKHVSFFSQMTSVRLCNTVEETLI